MVGSLYTGQFLTPLWTGPDPAGTAFTSSTTPATVTIRPDILRDPNLPSSERTVATAGSFRNLGEGRDQGPGLGRLHIARKKPRYGFVDAERRRKAAQRPSAAGVDGYERLVVTDPAAGPLWARFYEIGTNRPISSGRDGVLRYNVAEIEEERRNHHTLVRRHACRAAGQGLPCLAKGLAAALTAFGGA